MAIVKFLFIQISEFITGYNKTFITTYTENPRVIVVPIIFVGKQLPAAITLANYYPRAFLYIHVRIIKN